MAVRTCHVVSSQKAPVVSLSTESTVQSVNLRSRNRNAANEGMSVRVCVCTSFPADCEPRAPRHARAFHDLGNVALTFVDAAAIGRPQPQLGAFKGLRNFNWYTCRFPTRNKQPVQWFVRKLQFKIARLQASLRRTIRNDALSSSLRGFESLLVNSRPDVIMAHNIDTLYPAYRAALRCGAALIFDSMEFHSDMGEGQDLLQVQLIKRIEALTLPACQLVTTVSRHAIEALQSTYNIKNLVALHNVPEIHAELSSQKVERFGLYWRNSTLGLGQRGLADAMHALTKLPRDIDLHLQGRPAHDNGSAVAELARNLGITDRVIVHSPYEPGQAVNQAARFHVGLCMEHGGIRNHEIALSNKVFDYHMAGLAVVASDLPAMSDLIQRSGGGLTYQAGNVEDLARKIMHIYQNPELYKILSCSARRFGLAEGNSLHEMKRFREAIEPILNRRALAAQA